MSTTSDRLVSMIKEHLDLDRQPDLNRRFEDAGINSLVCVEFVRLVEAEFGLSFTPEECTRMGSLQSFCDLIDSRLAN
ncbi:MAG: phosphopantetheine-binding protein [Gemmatimonadota bacterium]|nr:phosphopantetheine-binding protein [Gemmatimonadota bacterium]